MVRSRSPVQFRVSAQMNIQMVKVVTTVPASHADAVRKAAGAAAGLFGNYQDCSFSVRGVGRFTPLSGANPVIGEIGKPESVEEEQIFFTCPKEIAEAVVAAIKKAHPYEIPVIDVYLLETL